MFQNIFIILFYLSFYYSYIISLLYILLMFIIIFVNLSRYFFTKISDLLSFLQQEQFFNDNII